MKTITIACSLLLAVPLTLLATTSGGAGAINTVSNEREGTQKPVPVTVLHCNDGDTCRVRVGDGLWMDVRLAGIDAPEFRERNAAKSQPIGQQSRDFLNELVKGKAVNLIQSDLDRYNRPVVEMMLTPDSSANVLLVEKGFAEAYRGRAKRLDRDKFLKAESAAKSAKAGIWGIADYKSPAEFRKKANDQK